MLFNPFIEIVNIKVYSFSCFYTGQTTGPNKLTHGRDRPTQINRSL